jgi:hypothetical protein
MGETSLLTRLPGKDTRLSADALFRLGLKLSGLGLSACGEDGRSDLITAHALFEIAGRQGSIEAKIYRRELGDEMDFADVADAQRLVRDWLARRPASGCD